MCIRTWSMCNYTFIDRCRHEEAGMCYWCVWGSPLHSDIQFTLNRLRSSSCMHTFMYESLANMLESFTLELLVSLVRSGIGIELWTLHRPKSLCIQNNIRFRRIIILLVFVLVVFHGFMCECFRSVFSTDIYLYSVGIKFYFFCISSIGTRCWRIRKTKRIRYTSPYINSVSSWINFRILWVIQHFF